MRVSFTRIMFTTGVLAAALAGCTPEPETPIANEVGGETITSTVVAFGADGIHVVRVDTLTLAQLEAEKAERAAGHSKSWQQSPDHQYTLAQASCDDRATIWLFDKPGLAGNRVCLRRFGSDVDDVNLVFVPRPPVFQRHWGAAVRSFWAGTDRGYFRLGQSPFSTQTFAALQQALSVESVVANSIVLALF